MTIAGIKLATRDYAKGGNVLYAFDLTDDECGSGCHTTTGQNGNLSLSMRFDQNGVNESCIAVVYLLFDKNIYIDQNRNVIVDFA